MGGVYRTSALPAPSRKVIAFGTGERLIIRLPLTPPEVVARLSILAQKDSPTLRERKTGNHRPFVGRVQAPNFRIKPLAKRAVALEVRGSVHADGANSIVTLNIALTFRSLIIGALSVALALLFAVSQPSTAGALYYVARASIFVFATIAAALVSVRVGLSDVRRKILGALDPSSPLDTESASHELPERPPLDAGELVKRLDDWERERFK